MSLNDWEDSFYDKVFTETLNKLSYRREKTPASLQDMKDTLASLYVLEGNNWIGRGLVGDITSAATIAAYEHFISEWEASDL